MATTVIVTLNGFINDVLDARDRILALDLTGDGKSDFLWYRPGGGFAGAYLSNGDGTLRFIPYRDFRGKHNGFEGDVMDPRDCAVPIDLRGDKRTRHPVPWTRPRGCKGSARISGSQR